MRISRTTLNFCVDASLLLLLVTLLWASSVVRFVFPQAADARGWSVWGWSYDQWTAGCFGLLVTLALGVLLHVMLHWNWVCGVIVTRLLPRNGGKRAAMSEGAQTLYGVSLLVVLLHVVGLGIVAAKLMVQTP